MYSSITSFTISGINAVPVLVETDISDGLPIMELVGYLGNEVKEAKERVKTALKNSSIKLPARRITVNISPADIRKQGTSFDLPIALTLLCCMEIITPESLSSLCALGELCLDGKIKGVNGVLPHIIKAKELGIKRCLVPAENIEEAGIIEDIDCYGVSTLSDAILFLNGTLPLSPHKTNITDLLKAEGTLFPIDFSELNGQPLLRRTIEIAASGRHNLLMIGPPGAGKTMAARRLPTIMPPLDYDESIELTKIYSIAGKLPETGIITTRPFVSPHHTATPQALAGGGSIPKPGAVSLSHHAILFLDELPEFSRDSLEILRQPIEDKVVSISRARNTFTFPADFLLVAAMNPCKCGYFPDRSRCHCTEREISKYINRISGPLLDRIDICAQADEINYEEISSTCKNENSASIRARVLEARARQKYRFSGSDITVNSQMNPRQVAKYCRLDAKEEALLKEAYASLKLSARSYHKLLKTARTIADMAGSEKIKEPHLYEALNYRTIDLGYN